MGTAHGFSLRVSFPNDERETTLVHIPISGYKGGANALAPGEKGSILLVYELNLSIDGMGNKEIIDIRKKYTQSFNSELTYYDILDNKFTQDLRFRLSCYTAMNRDTGKKEEFLADFFLESTSAPLKK